MKFGYTIVYVPSVTQVLAFYKEAFGFETRFLHDSEQYGELATGATVLAFASHAMGDMNLGGLYQRTDPNAAPLGVELAFVTDDVAGAYARAVAAGASPIKGPIVGHLATLDADQAAAHERTLPDGEALGPDSGLCPRHGRFADRTLFSHGRLNRY